MATSNEPLRRYLSVQRVYDGELNRTLEAAARDIRAQVTKLPPGIGGRVRRAQLERVLAEIKTEQRAMWSDDVLGIVARGRKAAAETADLVTDAITAVLYAALPERVAAVLTAGLKGAAREGLEAMFARVPRQLSERVYRAGTLSSGRVEQMIRSGLVRGLSPRELAREVYQFISPSAPGGVSYAAMRLARTEINNAFHQRQITGGQRPGVTGIRWNLSGSHKVPDECNLYAERDQFRKGKGVFPQ